MTERREMATIAGTAKWLVPFGAALAVAAVTRVVWPFDGLYGQDAFAYFRYAEALWPHWLQGTPLPTLYWPIGYPVSVALFLPLTGGDPLAGQIVNAFSCACAAAATAVIVDAYEAEGERDESSASIAGLAVATSGAMLRSSQVVMADGLGLGAASLALCCAVQYARTQRGPWLTGSTLAWAVGMAARWMVGLLALPILGCLAVCAWKRRKEPGARGGAPWIWCVAGALGAAAILWPVLGAAQAEPHALAKHEWLVGWSPASAWSREFHTPEGHAVYHLPVALFYLVRMAWPDYFFPGFAILALIGALVLSTHRRWSWVLLLIGWPATAWLLLSGIPYENPRFLLPTLPAVGALLGIGLGWARAAMRPIAPRVLTPALIGCAAAGLALGAREHARLVAAKNMDVGLVTWMAERLPPHPQLLMAGPTLALQHYRSIEAHELFSSTSADIDALLNSREPLFLLANVDVLHGQWNGLTMEQSFDRLMRDPGLHPIGVHAPYTLFRVGSGE